MLRDAGPSAAKNIVCMGLAAGLIVFGGEHFYTMSKGVEMQEEERDGFPEKNESWPGRYS